MKPTLVYTIHSQVSAAQHDYKLPQTWYTLQVDFTEYCEILAPNGITAMCLLVL